MSDPSVIYSLIFIGGLIIGILLGVAGAKGKL